MKPQLFVTLALAQDWLRDNGFSMVNPRLWTNGAVSALIRDRDLQTGTVIVRFEALAAIQEK